MSGTQQEPGAGTSGAAGGVEQAAGRRTWAALLVLCTGQLMLILDSTVVNVALPSIQRQLHFSQASLAWVVNAYLLTFGGLLLFAGRLGDLLGRRKVFLSGLAAFTASSMLCGLAPSSGVLVAARLLQGASAAMVGSMVLGIISSMFPAPRERTRALSFFTCVAIGGSTLGQVLGGVVIALLNWHWIFFINVPTGTVTAILGFRLVDKQSGLGIRAGADVVGAVLVTSAPTLAVFGLVNAGIHGWRSALTLGPLVGSIALGMVFVIGEGRVRTPLIPLTLFRHRALTRTTIVRLLFQMGGFGSNFIASLYLQHVLRYSPLRTGLSFLPASILTMVGSLMVAPWLLRRVSAKTLVRVGLLLNTAGLLAMARITAGSTYIPDVLPTMVLNGAGVGLWFMPSVSIAMSDVGSAESGTASGLLNTAVQLGASIGVAVLASVSAARTVGLLAKHIPVADALTGGYRLGFLVAAGCTTSSLVAACLLLGSRTPRPAESLVPGSSVEDGGAPRESRRVLGGSTRGATSPRRRPFIGD